MHFSQTKSGVPQVNYENEKGEIFIIDSIGVNPAEGVKYLLVLGNSGSNAGRIEILPPGDDITGGGCPAHGGICHGAVIAA